MLTNSQQVLFSQAFLYAESQLHHLITIHPDYFPIYTRQGKWKHDSPSWTNWCEGFLGGQLWLIYQSNKDRWWWDQAIHYSELVKNRRFDRNVHDLGFIFWPTWKRWYDISGDSSLNHVVFQAGETLAMRYVEKGHYLQSFLSEDSLFIDIMMNVGIIIYTAQQTNSVGLMEKAIHHCLTTRKYLVRGDGSTAHEGIFNLETGEFLRQSTQQGWRNDSSWARGLAWAIYGFTSVYQFTRDDRFLKTAEMCAEYYIDHTPEHGIPPNDWDEPSPKYPYESSAAAITASGLLELSEACGDEIKSGHFRNYALEILETLSGPLFLANGDKNWEGILKHGIYHLGKNLGVDESVMWGDYFYLEALSKVLDDR